MNPRLKNVLRRVKHRVWPVLGRARNLALGVALRVRYLVRGLPATVRLTSSSQQAKVRHAFGQGLVTSHRHMSMYGWSLGHLRPTVVVIGHAGEEADRSPDEFDRWMREVRVLLGSAFVLHDPTGNATSPRADTWTVPVDRLRRELLRVFPEHDVVTIDAREQLPPVSSLVQLKYAAYKYPDARRIGAVVPARSDESGVVHAGVDFDRTAGRWAPSGGPGERDYGQVTIPRYVLTDQFHGAYLKAEFVRSVAAPDHPRDLDELVAAWLVAGWKSSRRTLLYAPVVLPTRQTVMPAPELADWQHNRTVRDDQGRIRVIFVLPATSLSGGLRAAMEMAEGLYHRGFDVEIWSVQGQPSWTDIELRVVQFKNMLDLGEALADQDAIKVATWWETGQVVWLGSVNRGIPLQYVQEFETWFYPGDEVAEAAVVSSYRREFVYTTIARFQQQELAELGIEAELIPSAFDETIFHSQEDVVRDQGTLLALGRSFFQKNFTLTLKAWQSLGERRPQLSLFGIEPGIASDARITYALRPTDEDVARLYASATCFIQTSRHEGFCLPIIEAMACGCPVITTDSHGNDFCVDGENCVMVEQDDTVGVAAAIERVMGDPELRAQLSAAGMATARNYTWTRILEKTAAFYQEVADRALR